MISSLAAGGLFWKGIRDFPADHLGKAKYSLADSHVARNHCRMRLSHSPMVVDGSLYATAIPPHGAVSITSGARSLQHEPYPLRVLNGCFRSKNV